MLTLTKVSGGYPVNYIPPEWSRDFEVHPSRLTPDQPLLGPHGKVVQHSLPLFRLVHISLSVSSLIPISRRSPPPDSQPMSIAKEHPATTAAHQVAHGAAEVTAVKLVRPGRWTEANVGVLRSDYPTLRPVRDISVEVGRSVSAIYGKARRLKLKRLPRAAASTPDGVLPSLSDLFMEPRPSLTKTA